MLSFQISLIKNVQDNIRNSSLRSMFLNTLYEMTTHVSTPLQYDINIVSDIYTVCMNTIYLSFAIGYTHYIEETISTNICSPIDILYFQC